MYKLIQEINKLKNEDVVFIGGTSLMLQGLKDFEKCNDIDIIIKDVSGLDSFGSIQKFKTKSAFSPSGNRAFIERNDYNIDIFLEPFPEYVIVDGFKCQTVNSMIEYYENVMNKVEGRRLRYLQAKVEFIKKQSNE